MFIEYNFWGMIFILLFIVFLITMTIWEWKRYNYYHRWNIWIDRKIEYHKYWLKGKPTEWAEWLKNLSGLKKFYFTIAIVITSIFVYSFWFIFPEFIDKIDDKDTSFYNLSLAVFAILSGFGAVFGFYTSILRTETAEQGLITDRINKATEGIGKNYEDGRAVVEVRLGALYALERIAQDSIRDHMQIIEMLCAYVRHNSPLKNTTDESKPLREDIQAALSIIGRRETWPNGKRRIKNEKAQDKYLDLSNCDLHGANLNGANLSDVTLDGANLNNAILSNADLTRSRISNITVKATWFHHTKMRGSFCSKCDFSECQFIGQEQINDMYCGIGVEIPFYQERPKGWPTHDLTEAELEVDFLEWAEDKYGVHML